MSVMGEKQLDDILAKAKELALGDSPLDNMTIKELKLAVTNPADKVTDDQKASIVTVVVLVITVAD